MRFKRKLRASNKQDLTTHVRPWLWLGILALAIGGLLAFAAQGQIRGDGILTAETTLQDLGQVPIYGGLVEATFPLTVEGETRIAGITTS
jgi:hypothetical protein